MNKRVSTTQNYKRILDCGKGVEVLQSPNGYAVVSSKNPYFFNDACSSIEQAQKRVESALRSHDRISRKKK